eukprot:4307318-Pleurochrysis_carterae.AAC.1
MALPIAPGLAPTAPTPADSACDGPSAEMACARCGCCANAAAEKVSSKSSAKSISSDSDGPPSSE